MRVRGCSSAYLGHSLICYGVGSARVALTSTRDGGGGSPALPPLSPCVQVRVRGVVREVTGTQEDEAQQQVGGKGG